MRFARDGLRGKGNYFAISSSYSCGGYQYDYTDGSRHKGVFLAKVVIGESTENYDSNTKSHPAFMKDGKTRYDSVTNSSAGHYIVYANNKCYPLYYIKYM